MKREQKSAPSAWSLAWRSPAILIAVLMAPVLWTVFFLNASVEKQRALEHAKSQTAGVVRVFQEGTERVLLDVDRTLRLLRRWLPVTGELHGQRFTVREHGRLLATPLLAALVAIEAADLIFAVDSVPAVLAVTTDPFVVYTSNVFALLGLRALYFLLAGAAARLRYLRPALAVILAAVAAKLLLADVWEFPAWSAPAFIVAVLAVATAASVRGNRRAREDGDRPDGASPADVSPAPQHAGGPR